MSIKSRVFTFVLLGAFSFASSQLLAEGKSKTPKLSANAKKAQMILEKANKTLMEMQGFSATIVTVPAMGKKQKGKYYQLNNPDGTIWLRMEMGGKKNPITFISNDDGYWYLTGNTAIKMAYMTKMQVNAMANVGQISKIQKGGKYSLKSGKINARGCYIVTTHVSNEQFKAALELSKKMITEDMRKMMKKMKTKIDFSSKIPLLTQCYIGKKNYFPYSTVQYNKNGARLSKMTYKNVKLNIEPDEKLFQIPKTMEVKIANTIMEYATFMMGTLEVKKKK